MRGRILSFIAIGLTCALTAPIRQAGARQDFEVKPGLSVYVEVLKVSAPVEPNLDRIVREASLRPFQAAEGVPDKRDSAPAAPILDSVTGRRILDRATPLPNRETSADLPLKQVIEKEFTKRKKFSLARSPETADFIFLALSRYAYLQVKGDSYKMSATNISIASARLVVRDIVGLAIPTPDYQQARKSIVDLCDAASWQGAVSYKPSVVNLDEPTQITTAKDLVKLFHGEAMKKPRQGSAVAQTDPPQENKAAESAPPESLPAPPQEEAANEPESIKLDSTLVMVPVTALDRDGRYVSDLTKQNFQIFEDGVQQEITYFDAIEAPFNVVLLLDTSDSTRFKVEDIQRAALAFIDELRPQDRVMVVSFDRQIYIDSEFTADRAELRRAINGTRTGGGTRLYDAVDLVLTERLSQIEGRKAIVLFSDGVDSQSRLAGAASTVTLADEAGAIVYVIQYDTISDSGKAASAGKQKRRPPVPSLPTGEADYGRGTQYLRELSQRSGGRWYPAEGVADFSKAFSLAAKELRHQYAISYYPSDATPDGKYRRIEVRVNRPDVTVQARAGYRMGQRD